MTYLNGGQEFLTSDELDVWRAVGQLAVRTTGNTSMVAVRARLPRTSTAGILNTLRSRGFVKDVSKNAAHHWRQTEKVPANA